MLIYNYRAFFNLILAFNQTDFQPSSTNMLLMDVALAWFIQSKQPECMLKDHHRVGAHTDIYIFKPDNIVKQYVWSHPGRRPFGQSIPLQCVICKSIKSWGKPDIKRTSGAYATSYILTCQSCGHMLRADRPANFIKYTPGPLDKSERGDWYLENIKVILN